VKTERRDIDNRSDRPLDAKIVPFRLQDQAANFSIALQQQRERTAPHDREQKHGGESRSRRSGSPPTTSADARPSTLSAVLKMTPGETQPQPLLSLLSTLGNCREHADPSAAMPRPNRPRRTLADPESSHCIEVAHPRTGVKFVLSQKDGVWLLSIDEQSSMDPAELQPFLTYLREQFAERGLGPVDLIA
jgi:hypothetical protein